MEERGEPEAGTVMVAGHLLYLQQAAIYGDHNWGTLLTAIIAGLDTSTRAWLLDFWRRMTRCLLLP